MRIAKHAHVIFVVYAVSAILQVLVVGSSGGILKLLMLSSATACRPATSVLHSAPSPILAASLPLPKRMLR